MLAQTLFRTGRRGALLCAPLITAGLIVAACGGGEGEAPSSAAPFAERPPSGAVQAPADPNAEASGDSGEAALTAPDAPAPETSADAEGLASGAPGASRVELAIPANTPAREGEAQPAAELLGSGLFEAAAGLNVERVARGVVLVEMVAFDETGAPFVLGNGSGSIVDASGLVLTNYHVVDPSNGQDVMVVGVTDALDAAPSRRFVAEVVAVDPVLDLAVLRLATDLNGAPVKAESLGLMALPIGDSSTVSVLDPILAVGYPGIGDATLTVTAGAISGFLSQAGVAEQRAWFKTDTTITFGNSGGAAVDERGRLIGVPTQGVFDEGGAIAHLRPIALALPLIAIARGGALPVEQGGGAAQSDSRVFNVAFGSAVGESGALLDLRSEFPDGAEAIFYAFDFQGIAAGTAWVDRWYRDGSLIPELSGERPPWAAGAAGTYLTGIESAAGFAAGLYTLEIVLAGEVVASRSLTVGEGGAQPPTIERLRFAAAIDAGESPVGVATHFEAGTVEVFSFFDYASAGGAQTVEARWFREGALVLVRGPEPWSGGGSGGWWFSLRDEGGLVAGEYAVEIAFDGTAAGSAEWTVERATGGVAAARELQLGEEVSGVLGAGEVALFRLSDFIYPISDELGLLVTLSGDGDADLYVKALVPPLVEELGRSWSGPALHAPYLAGSAEGVYLPGAEVGDWWILVVGVAESNRYELVTSVRDAPRERSATLEAGSRVTGTLDAANPFDEYVVLVPPGASLLRLTMEGSGDADLYVRFGAPVQREQLLQGWDGPKLFAPYLVGSEEEVLVGEPAAGAWFVRVEGFEPGSGYRLLLTLE